MIKYIILIAVFVAAYYLLYISGYLTLNMKSAIKFTGSIKGADRCSAKFTSCDGTMKRVIRFPSDKAYSFNLDSRLTKGALNVELLNADKETVMVLNENSHSAVVNVQAGKRYYLVFKFDNTSGEYKLNWGINRDNNV